MRENIFQSDKGSRIILDFSACQNLQEIHLLLKEKFGLPEYYGKNWDALWDCLDGLFYRCGDITVEIHGLGMLSSDLREQCRPMLAVFDDIHTSAPNVVFCMVT